MKVIAGLGNPGAKYETTRHNLGFLALDRLIEAWGITRSKKTKREELWETQLFGQKIVLIKPNTFMNLSGKSIAPFCDFFKVEPKDLLVIYDDLDLAPFQLKIKDGGGTGGHNGLKSIEEAWGHSKNGYARIRIGIGKPETVGSRVPTSDYVVQPLNNSELKILDEILEKTTKATELWIQEKLSEAMNQFNQKISKET